MFEASKAVSRRLHTPGFATRFFVGDGIDVGCGSDSLSNHRALFPLMGRITDHDLEHGDAQFLARHADSSFDFLHSSHCLEHLKDPFEALTNWCRVVRTGGHLIVLVPDEDMYEQGVWPSTWNRDHKKTFTICKKSSWSPVSVNLTNLLEYVAGKAMPIRVELLCHTFVPGADRRDHTLNSFTESGIEFVLRRI